MTQVFSPSVRFVHAPKVFDTDHCPYSGFTILYVRTEDWVDFTYSLCHKKDQYSKVIGRNETAKTWEQVSVDYPLVSSEHPHENFIDTKNRFGIVSVTVFRESVAGTNVFSDQMIDSMDMFDFKHAYISEMLYQLVVNHAVLAKHPFA